MMDRQSRHASGARRRLPRPLYALVTRLIPVPCIDVAPFRRHNGVVQIGLIRRLGDQRTTVWALIGGGVLREEALRDAAARHIRSTLGQGVRWKEPDFDYPATVGEYFPRPREGAAYDRRKHAVALTYVVELDGEPEPQGEALDFDWFDQDALPLHEMGFGQEFVVRRLLPIRS